MDKLNYTNTYFYLILLSTLLARCGTRDDPRRNKLAFQDGITHIAIAMDRMTYFMSKFPQKDIVRYAIDDDGFLYLNQSKYVYHPDSVVNQELRNSNVLRKLSESEKDEFFNLLVYLRKNYITYAYSEPMLGQVSFSYRTMNNETAWNTRDVVLLYSYTDTTSMMFKKHFKILDLKENLMLLAIKPLP